MKKIIRLLLVLLLLNTILFAGVLATFGGTKGQADKELKEFESKFAQAGLSVAAINMHLENHYYASFKEKNLDLLNFYRVYNKEGIREFLLRDPNYGAYTPFNFLAYKKPKGNEGSEYTWYGHLDSTTMLDIINEKNLRYREKFTQMIKKFDDVIIKNLQPTQKKVLTFEKPIPSNSLLKMVKKFTADDVDSFVEDFIMEHDSLFTQNNFVVAGFLDLKFEYYNDDLDFDKYDAYWVTSLCHFEFSNAVFNHGNPQAGVFAPCSIYFYIPKGKKELHVGYAKVENWIVSTNVQNKQQIEFMGKIANEVQALYEKLGFVVEGDTNNTTSSAEQTSTKLQELETITVQNQASIEALKEEVTKLKQKLESAQNASPTVVKFEGEPLDLNAQMPAKLPTYYLAQPQSLESLRSNLKEQGFDIVAESDILDDKKVISITNQELKETNTFLAVLNLLYTPQEIRVQNPYYFGVAYLQNDFNEDALKNTLDALQKSLGKLYSSKEKVDSLRLKDYSFMYRMPKFEDMIEVGRGKDMLEKLKKSKNISYTLELPNGSILVGHTLRGITTKFLTKINEEKNALLLPYQSLIKDEKAHMLNPEFYLALSLPLLEMGDFMKIASTPDAIVDDIKRVYR